MPVGNYNEVWIKIGSLSILPNIGNVESAKVLSQDIKFAANFTVNSDNVPIVTLDFILNEALHSTENNTYIFAPVVHFRSRYADIVEISALEEVKAAGGSSGFNIKVGVDENGVIQQNYSLNPNFIITVLSSGALKLLNSGELEKDFTISAEQAIELAISGG